MISGRVPTRIAHKLFGRPVRAAVPVWVEEGWAVRAVRWNLQCAARAIAGVPLVARARVLPRTFVVAQRVDIAVVGLFVVAVEDLGAVDAVVEDVPAVTLAAVRVGPDVRARPDRRARVADAVVDVRAHLAVPDIPGRAGVAREARRVASSVGRGGHVSARHLRVLETRRRRTAVRVGARHTVAGPALVARARVLPRTFVVAQRVDIAVVDQLQILQTACKIV